MTPEANKLRVDLYRVSGGPPGPNESPIRSWDRAYMLAEKALEDLCRQIRSRENHDIYLDLETYGSDVGVDFGIECTDSANTKLNKVKRASLYRPEGRITLVLVNCAINQNGANAMRGDYGPKTKPYGIVNAALPEEQLFKNAVKHEIMHTIVTEENAPGTHPGGKSDEHTYGEQYGFWTTRNSPFILTYANPLDPDPQNCCDGNDVEATRFAQHDGQPTDCSTSEMAYYLKNEYGSSGPVYPLDEESDTGGDNR